VAVYDKNWGHGSWKAVILNAKHKTETAQRQSLKPSLNFLHSSIARLLTNSIKVLSRLQFILAKNRPIRQSEIKGLVHPKIKILPVITHPHVVPSP